MRFPPLPGVERRPARHAGRRPRLARQIIGAAGLGALWAPSAPACGAQPGPDAEAPATIVVTAQRRPEPAREVPISLSVISGEQLDRMQVTDTAALDRVVPSLVMMRTGAFTQPYLRGVGKRSALGVENGVATYVDGVYLASPISALLDLRDVARVEVLNGPQGTLFGRNATGGVIQVVTRDPTAATQAEARLDAGSYGFLRGDLYLAGGSDRLAANLSMSLSRNDGYGSNLFTGATDQGEVDHAFAARSKWIWRPDAPLTVTLAGDYQDIDQDFSSRPAAGFPPIGQPRILRFRDGEQNAPSRFRFRYGGVSARADVDLGGATLMSLSALRRTEARFGFDLDLGPLPLLAGVPNAEQAQFSQELQLLSREGSRVQWVAGLYYIHLDERYAPTRFSYGGSYSARLGGRTGQALFARGTASSYAAFGQGTWPIGTATRLTLGLRYTIETRSVAASGEQQFDNPPFTRPIPGLPLPSQPPLRNRDTFDELTWRASLDRRLSDAWMAYVSVNRGFQSGGWNLQTPQSPPYGPERLDSFEAGLRHVDHRQRFSADASLFYYDYSDIQVSAASAGGSVTTNATSAQAYGLELQVTGRLDQRTDISFGMQLLDARFDDFPNAICVDYRAAAVLPYAPVVCDVSGNRLPFAPALKLNLGANHRIPLGGSANLLLSGNIAHNDGYFAEADNVVRQPSFTVVDASAEWQPSPRWPSVRLWVTNLADARYSRALVAFPTAGVLQSPAAPRRFGVSAAYRY